VTEEPLGLGLRTHLQCLLDDVSGADGDGECHYQDDEGQAEARFPTLLMALLPALRRAPSASARQYIELFLASIA